MREDLENKISKSIARLQGFEPKDGYYLAFSGGKDSIVIKELAYLAGVHFDAHYMVTTIDPPDLVYFIREHHKDVEWHHPERPFLVEMVRRGFPLRQKRWCCEYLKEKGGEGRTVITGVRWAESAKRKTRKAIELVTDKKEDRMSFEDNEEGRRMMENCVKRGKFVVNPIIEWTDADVWEFIRKYNIPYCKLYDEGWKRIGCLMCPMAGRHRRVEAMRYPTITKSFIRFFLRLYTKNKDSASYSRWSSGKDMFNWWLKEDKYVPEHQLSFYDEYVNE